MLKTFVRNVTVRSTATRAEDLVAHVAADQNGAAAVLLDALLRLLRIVVFVKVDDRNVGAFLRKSDGDGAADAAISAGNDGDLALEPAAAGLPLVFRLRARLHLGLDSGLARLPLRWERFLLSHPCDVSAC